jgi:hypothetical protein
VLFLTPLQLAFAIFFRLSSVSVVMTWSSANSSVGSCWFFESLIPVMSWFRHLVIFSSKYILNSVGERGQSWRTPVLTFWRRNYFLNF